MDLEKQYIKNLRDAKDIFEKLGIKIWLDCGTLLGAYRDKKVIEGDEDDIDLVTWVSNKPRMAEVIEAFEKQGFELFRLRETVITMKRNGNKVDLFFADFYKDYYFLTIYYQKKPLALLVKRHWWDEFSQIKFYGMWFNAPYYIKEYLTYAYGDWKTPVLRPVFENYNPTMQKRANQTIMTQIINKQSEYEKRMAERTKNAMAEADLQLGENGLHKRIMPIDTKQKKFKCVLCEEWHDIDSRIGQKHLKKINS